MYPNHGRFGKHWSRGTPTTQCRFAVICLTQENLGSLPSTAPRTLQTGAFTRNESSVCLIVFAKCFWRQTSQISRLKVSSLFPKHTSFSLKSPWYAQTVGHMISFCVPTVQTHMSFRSGRTLKPTTNTTPSLRKRKDSSRKTQEGG